MGVKFFSIGITVGSLKQVIQCDAPDTTPTLNTLNVTPASPVRHLQAWQFLGDIGVAPKVIKNNINLYLCAVVSGSNVDVQGKDTNSDPADWEFTNITGNKYKISTVVNGTEYYLHKDNNNDIKLDSVNYTEWDILPHLGIPPQMQIILL